MNKKQDEIIEAKGENIYEYTEYGKMQTRLIYAKQLQETLYKILDGDKQNICLAIELENKNLTEKYLSMFQKHVRDAIYNREEIAKLYKAYKPE